MALPIIVPILAALGIGFVAFKAMGKKTSTSTAPFAQDERKGVSVVRGALRFDPDVASKILASLTLYKTTGLEHQPAPNVPNSAKMTKVDVMQEGNDRGFQFAALESGNGNAILAPEGLWALSTMPKELVIRAVHPSRLAGRGGAAAPGSGWAILTDTTGIAALATTPSKEVVASLGGSTLGSA
jgi:hypothetical protein